MASRSNKNTVKNIAIFAIVFIIYSIISFVVPFKHTQTFWGAYIFGAVAIVLQIGVIFLALYGARTMRKKVYAFPVIKTGIIYLAVQLAVSLTFSIVATYKDIPSWIVYVVSAVILGVFIVLILLTDTAKDEIVHVEEQTERNTVQIKTFRVNIDSILRRTEDEELLKKLEKLSDIAKYSDPVSCEALYAIEREITQKIDMLSAAVRNGEVEQAKMLAEEIIDLFDDRNAQCKMFKKN